MVPENITRRKFLQQSAAAAAAGAVFASSPKLLLGDEKRKVRVVLIRDENVINEQYQVNANAAEKMLDKGVSELLNDDASSAWKKLIKPEDVVGIKSNIWHYLPTPPQLEAALKSRVKNAGVPEKNISINDQGVLRDPVFKKATALINIRPMRTHYWAGVGSCIKDYIMFVDNPPDYHDDSCADLAAIWKLPVVAGKTRLNILVMFTPLFHGTGPHHFSPQYIWPYKGMIIGTDPVAVDTVGLRIIEAKRKEYFKEDRPLNPPAKHIYLADVRHQLGTSDINKIELIILGWKEGILI